MKLDTYHYQPDPRTSLHSGRAKSKSIERRGDTDEQVDPEDGVCIPKLPNLGVIYYCLSTVTHLIIFIHSVLLKVRSVPKDRLANDFITCYMPRVHFHEYLGQSKMIWFSILFSSLHLLYRCFILVHGFNARLDVIPFLLLDRFNRIQETPSLVQSDAVGFSNHWDSLLFLRISFARRHRIASRLRPNRTAASRAKMIRLTDSSFIFSVVILICPLVVLVPIGVSELFFNHEAIFEGCHISYFDRVYWLRALSSLYTCSLITVDSYLMFTFPIGMSGVLIFDLMSYWSHIEEKLWQLRSLLAHPSLAEPIWMISARGRGTEVLDNQKSCRVEFRKKNLDSEKDLCDELRALINDFFENLRFTNKYISWIICFSFVVWLTSNALTTILGLQMRSTTEHTIIVRGFQLIGIFFIALISHLVLNLKRRTQPAYTTICSLMALDESRRKEEWIKSLRYYTDKKSFYAFTFPGSGMFDELMFFKFISYTLTLTLYFEIIRFHV